MGITSSNLCRFFSGKVSVPEKKPEPAVRYEYKYLDKYDKLKTLHDTDAVINLNTIVMENTPAGNVIMNYDSENKAFNYYCDKKDVPFKYLETVARKYVINNQCIDIYIDIRDELCEKKVVVAEVKDDAPKKNNVFATFKQYKSGDQTKQGQVQDNRSTQANMQKNHSMPKNISKNKSKDDPKKMIFKERVNKYKHRGKVCDFTMLEKTHILSNSVVSEDISFASFKLLQKV